MEGVSFDDRFFECGNENHQFDYLTSSGATTGVIRWTCLEQATFPIGSIASQPKTIPSVSVLSDWTDTTNSKFCYTRNESPTSAPVSPVSVTSSPILTTTAPIVAPIAAAFPATFRPILLSSQVPSPATTRDSSGSSTGIVIGAAAGGAIVAIVFAIVVVVLVLRRSPSNNVKPVKDDTHDATSGGLPVEAHDEHVTDVEEHVAINRPIQRVSVSEASTPQNDTLSYATSNSASRPSVASSSSRPMNPNDLHYKDQSRSVQAIPIVSVVPPSIVDTQLQGRVDDSVQIDAYATAVATPVDMSHLSEISGASGGSGSTKRPTIDP